MKNIINEFYALCDAFLKMENIVIIIILAFIVFFFLYTAIDTKREHKRLKKIQGRNKLKKFCNICACNESVNNEAHCLKCLKTTGEHLPYFVPRMAASCEMCFYVDEGAHFAPCCHCNFTFSENLQSYFLSNKSAVIKNAKMNDEMKRRNNNK